MIVLIFNRVKSIMSENRRRQNAHVSALAPDSLTNTLAELIDNHIIIVSPSSVSFPRSFIVNS